jgi:hypothetical protein
MPANDQPQSRVEVDEDGTVAATATVDRPEGSPAARAALHVDPGHHAPGTSARLVDAVLETPEVREAGAVVAAVPRGDGEAIEHVHKRFPDATTRVAGATVIVEAEVPREE